MFTLDRMGKTAAKFDREKLEWMNGMYVRNSTIPRLVEAMKDYAQFNEAIWKDSDDELLASIAELFRERATTIRSLEAQCGWLFHAPSEYGPAKSIKKFLLRNESQGLAVLKDLLPALTQMSDWNEQELETVLNAFAERRTDGKLGSIAQPLRIALTGGPVSPPIFASLALLSQEETISRIDACLTLFAE